MSECGWDKLSAKIVLRWR